MSIWLFHIKECLQVVFSTKRYIGKKFLRLNGFCIFYLKEEEQSRLEAEMQKRRERIERWRAERKRKELESAKKEVQKGSLVTNIQVSATKKWSLEDDSGDEGMNNHVIQNS